MTALSPQIAGAGHAEGRTQLEFDDNLLLPLLYGERDQHLDRIERQLGVSVVTRGNRLVISGPASATEAAQLALSQLYERLKRGQEIDLQAVEAAVRLAEAEIGDKSLDFWREDCAFRTRKRRIMARSSGQAAYIKALRENELVFALGPAGTGKTYLAVAAAVDLLMSGRVDRIILSRPAVEAGERLGFLPGDLRDKVDPYLRPIFDALNDMLPADQLARRLGTGEIEVAPIAFMRGRTLSRAFVVLDEAQNTTPVQMKMFLTRLGEASRMVVTGDPTQVDLPAGARSGLGEALDVLAGVDGIVTVRLTDSDVVRHELVARIVRAYEAREVHRNRLILMTPIPTIDVALACTEWNRVCPGAKSLAREAARLALERGSAAAVLNWPNGVELGVVLADAAEQQRLNREHRGQDSPTNVLAFPAWEPRTRVPPLAPVLLGDVVLALETVGCEASEQGKPVANHLRHLVVHGVLHLLGYDHRTLSAAEAMESLERSVLAELGVPDPYRGPMSSNGTVLSYE